MTATSSTIHKRWVQLTQALERDSLKLERISGSHHIFTKPGRRCIPVAFHGGSVSPRYASVVRRQKLDWTVRLQRTKPMIARFAVIADDKACDSSVVRNHKVIPSSRKACSHKEATPVPKPEVEKMKLREAQTSQLQEKLLALRLERQQEHEFKERNGLPFWRSYNLSLLPMTTRLLSTPYLLLVPLESLGVHLRRVTFNAGGGQGTMPKRQVTMQARSA
jgi:hypothetical protein